MFFVEHLWDGSLDGKFGTAAGIYCWGVLRRYSYGGWGVGSYIYR